MGIVEELNELYERATSALAAVADPAGLSEWKSAYLGKQGAFTRLSRGLGALPAEQRPTVGQQVNTRRRELEQSGGYPVPPNQTPWQEIQRGCVGQLDTGAVLESAVKYQRIAQKVGTPRHNH